MLLTLFLLSQMTAEHVTMGIKGVPDKYFNHDFSYRVRSRSASSQPLESMSVLLRPLCCLFFY